MKLREDSPGREDIAARGIPEVGGGLDTSLDTVICDPPTWDPVKWWEVTEVWPRWLRLGPRWPEKWREGGASTVMDRFM